jgi:myo-inositol 2-dehydrogenase/D-chiro-inositol 1-dehydrogenase
MKDERFIFILHPSAFILLPDVIVYGDAMNPVRFGLIGYGTWGSQHARAVATTTGAELAAVAARSEASCARARADYPTVRIYSDYTELLAKEELDVVDVVLPSHLHYEAARAALASGRHLLLEKPMALELPHCDELIALAYTRKKILAVGHELRLSSLWGKAKEMIDQGAIGAPLYCLIELWRRPYRQGADGWRYDIHRVGNWILEEPIHFFDLARWYLTAAGPPRTVFARANSRQPAHPELHDNFSAIVNFPGGAYAVISQTLAAYEHHQVVKLTGTHGALWASWTGEMDRTHHPAFTLKHHDGQSVRDVPIASVAGEVYELENEMSMMVRAVREGTPPAATGEDGRWSVALCLAAQRSVDSGEMVSVSEADGERSRVRARSELRN